MLNGGSLYTFFSQSEVGTYQTMFHTMKTGNTFVNSTKEGVEKVRQGGFAYLTDGPYLDYYNSRNPCNTMMLENLLEAKSYGIALQRNSELTNPISVAILKVILNHCIHGHLIGEARYAWKQLTTNMRKNKTDLIIDQFLAPRRRCRGQAPWEMVGSSQWMSRPQSNG